jgi:hypothetical protein
VGLRMREPRGRTRRNPPPGSSRTRRPLSRTRSRPRRFGISRSYRSSHPDRWLRCSPKARRTFVTRRCSSRQQGKPRNHCPRRHMRHSTSQRRTCLPPCSTRLGTWSPRRCHGAPRHPPREVRCAPRTRKERRGRSASKAG